MKRIVFAAALLVAAVLSRRTEACQSFGQANGCFDFDPCHQQGFDPNTTYPMCGTFTKFDDSVPQQQVTVSCPSCPNQWDCGPQACINGGCGIQANLCLPACIQFNGCGTSSVPNPNGAGSSGYTMSCGACFQGVCDNGRCCNPSTCSSLGATCGTVSDGCGNSLACGGCASGQVCIASSGTATTCCTPSTCASLGFHCGSTTDGCGNALDCGPPPHGEACVNNQVTSCTHTTCAAQNLQCGFAPDGNCQGETLECGFCGNGYACTAGACVLDPSAPAAPHWALGGIGVLLLGFGVALMKRLG